MSTLHNESIADIGERHRRFLAYALLAYALMSMAHAVEHFLAGTAQNVAEGVQIAGVVTAMFFALRIAAWKIRNLSADVRHLYLDADGFVAQAVGRAHVSSWTITFLFTMVLAVFVEDFAQVPARVFLQGLLALMATTYAAHFLWLTRDPVDEAEDASHA